MPTPASQSESGTRALCWEGFWVHAELQDQEYSTFLAASVIGKEQGWGQWLFPLFTASGARLIWPTLLLFLVYLESSHCEMLLNLKKVWVCVCAGGGGGKKVPLFFSWESLTVLLQLKREWDGNLRGVEKDDFITRNFQPESNFK